MSSSESKTVKRQRQKRGPTGYGLFSKEQSAIVKSQHPDWVFAEISKHVATLWKGTSDKEKNEWQNKAADIKATMKESTVKESTVQESTVVTVDNDKKGSKKRKRKNGSSPSEPKPKRALSAYMFFVKENRADIKNNNPDASFVELATLVSSAWKETSDDDKKPYQLLADTDKKRYEAEKVAVKA